MTGTTPFDKQRFATAAYDEIRRIIREEEPPRPSTRLSTLGETLTKVSARRKTEPARLSALVKGDLDWIVMKALEKDRRRRYETASGLAADVRRFLAEEPVEARPPSAWYRFGKLARRHKAALTTTAVVAAALILGTVLSTWQALRATRAGRIALDAEQRAFVERDEPPRGGTRPRPRATSSAARSTTPTWSSSRPPGKGGRLGEVIRLLDREKADNPDLLRLRVELLDEAVSSRCENAFHARIQTESPSIASARRLQRRRLAARFELLGHSLQHRRPEHRCRVVDWTVWDTTSGEKMASLAFPEGDGIALPERRRLAPGHQPANPQRQDKWKARASADGGRDGHRPEARERQAAGE